MKNAKNFVLALFGAIALIAGCETKRLRSDQVVLIPVPGLSQDSGQYHACTDKAHTQTELNVCASKEAACVDAELNAVYQRFLAKAEGEQGAVEKIRAAENA